MAQPHLSLIEKHVICTEQIKRIWLNIQTTEGPMLTTAGDFRLADDIGTPYNLATKDKCVPNSKGL